MSRHLWRRHAALSVGRSVWGRGRSSRVLLIAAGLGAAAAVTGVAFAAFDPAFEQPPGSPFAVGTNPHSIVMVDVNRDKHVDLVTSNVGSNNVSILFGDGSGGFVAGVPIPVGAGPHSVATGYFNRDKRPDLAVANADADTISILLGNGDGTFTAASSLTAGDGSSRSPISTETRRRIWPFRISFRTVSRSCSGTARAGLRRPPRCRSGIRLTASPQSI